MKQIQTLNKQRGFTLIETLFILILASIATGVATAQYNKYLDNITNKQVADHAELVADAAGKYLKDYYSVIAATAGPSSPAVITVPMLKSTGYLDAGISNRNSFGQDYSVLVIQPVPNQLQALVVTTGGQAIAELDGRRIAQNMGAKGGFISKTNTTVATGSYGGWEMPLAQYSIAPGAGHIATALFLKDGAVVNDYLYRNAVPGHPELNRMNTAIDMNGKNINNAATVAATAVTTNTMTASGNITAANATIAGETTTGGWFRTTGDTGLYNQKWNGGWYMSDPSWVRSYADKGIYTGGEVLAGKVTSAGRTQVGEYLQMNGVAALWTGCSPNGLVSRDANGRPLSCQSGYWQTVGKNRVMSLSPFGGGITSFVTGQPYSMDLGWHNECVLTRFGDAQGEPARMTLGQVTPISGPDLFGRYQWLIELNAPVGSSVAATCYSDI